MKRRARVALTLVLALAAASAAVAVAWPRDQFIPARTPADWAPSAANIARGAYLARVGDCAACHTARAGPAYAGGRALATPFGTMYGPNLTPDAATGLGAWRADDFWGALHNGRARDGRYLAPAFPFAHYSRVTRADSDALYAFLRSLPAERRANLAHELAFPFNTQFALAAWRLLFFRPAVFAPEPTRAASWNRGAYLVTGLGHCGACHSARNAFGASAPGLDGGLLAAQGWYAPSLHSDAEAGLARWPRAQVVALLRSGSTAQATVSGPMAEVVARSLQYLTLDDADAMASYLQALPARPAPEITSPGASPGAESASVDEATIDAGKRLYGRHCASCHGDDGNGLAPAYPPLAGNRAVTMAQAVNPVRAVLHGGFAPGTAGNPRPYGMPPFAHVLDDTEVAQVVTYLRASWGNHAGAVSAAQVNRLRSAPLE